MHIFILLGYVWFLENTRERKKIVRKIIFSLDDMKNMMKKKGKKMLKIILKYFPHHFTSKLVRKIREDGRKA